MKPVKKQNDTISLAALMLTKGSEILHWMGAALMALLLVLSLAAWGWLGPILERGAEQFGRSLTTYGFELVLFDAVGRVDMRAIALFAACAVAVLSLMAMVFRNTHLILKRSQDATPFQPDNIRMLREIGLFMISAPLIELFFSFAARLVLTPGTAELSVSLDGIFMGILALCLTRVFAHGMELEQDVDGLM